MKTPTGRSGGRDAPEARLGDALLRYREVAGDWAGFIRAMATPLPACLWANPLRVEPDELAALLRAEGLHPEPVGWLPGAFRLAPGERTGGRWWYVAGLAHAQEEASLMPVSLLDPRPGHRVLDLCAAPGGKTARIAVALGNRGTVVANEVSAARCRALQGNLERLGVVNVSITRLDGGNLPPSMGAFDRVLVDAPCSGEGTFRRDPPKAGRPAPDYARMARRQWALLKKAVQLCRPGGRIVYSTCTFAPEENEAVIQRCLEAFPETVEILPARLAGVPQSPGLTEWEGQGFDASMARCLRLWPHVHDTGGFFMALLGKRGGDSPPEPEVGGLAEPEDAAWREVLTERYGFDDSVWNRYRVHRRTRRGLHLAAADHRPPARPAPESTGLFFYNDHSTPPKLTTAAALLLGTHARRNRVELQAQEVAAYLARRDLPWPAERAVGLRAGHVLVLYRGFVLGVGVYHARSGTLESLFPLRWSGRSGPDPA